MKAKDVLRILSITRPTLTKYVKEGIIGTNTLPNGRYDYIEEDVYAFLNKGMKRNTFIYARVSTSKQKKDLEKQIEQLKQFCFSNGWQINRIFKDVASGISFEKRKQFFEMLDDVVSGKVERVIITYKDRMSRVGFDLFKHLFDKYNTEIIVMSEIGNVKLDSEEVFEEIVSLLHCYSMKMYSKRKNKVIKELIEREEPE
ncbi:IS607 family transposase [Niallia sp. NCCP-28]|uniref:IS607 family transposase n=1 Tax=Niallia sp. NCCP-28 TaxID=2934712 RepID=UPI00208213CA|nr:IS607 family transposase [Niallia sp. NCCP-28]GKU83014.1 IS607 family transposase ISTko2 [Niallia sp. NCCP-28]